MVNAPVITSAAGVLSMLDEPDQQLKVYALKSLLTLVDQFWAEIADSVTKIEILSENEGFAERHLAALVASKVYYHLGEFDESVNFALGAGNLFDIENSARSQYVDTIVGKCIDKYSALRSAEGGQTAKIDPRLTAIVERMFKRCLDDKEYKQAIGVALESHRLDIIEASILKGNQDELLGYTLDVCMNLVQNLTFRNQVLETLVKLYKSSKNPDYIAVCQCFVWLHHPESTAKILEDLWNKGDENSRLTAYQIAFDTYENATQEFLSKLLNCLPVVKTANKDTNEMETDDKVVLSPRDEVIAHLRSILSGQVTIKLHLEFLYRNNKADLLILKATKTTLESRSSVYHSAVTFAHAFMNAGTTSDQFLRDNMDWLARASNWTKFSATAQLGVIHKGNIANSMSLLKPYLPQDGVSGSFYSEGGSLYALGLIHANHGTEVLDYLKKQLKATQNEVVQHGACLGLGAAGMATESEEIYEALKTVLFTDSAVAGEAAGLAMGLVMLGTGNKKAVDEMIQYAHDTQHEKIIRGLAVGLALLAYGREEKADTLIDQLLTDKDPILRYGGVYSIALAYGATANNKVIRKLLHLAVSDVNDDVRRVAVMALGYVLVRTPKQVPRIVQLLSESYNAHVRYGSAMALGVACAGTGMAEALALLEPLTKDSVDYVRQAAFIATAMVLVQQNEASNSKVKHYRELYHKVITAKHEDTMARFGAVLAQGIIDAGGRNVTISLLSDNGHLSMEAAVGFTLFTQHWYWYPLTHFLCLAFTPTPIIGLTADLKIPKFDFQCSTRPALVAYPPPTPAPTTEKVEKVATAVLSTTNKVKARARKAEAEKAKDQPESMETDEKKAEAEKEKEKKEPVKKEEPKLDYSFSNLARVLPSQRKCLSFPASSRFAPIKKGINGGILLVKDQDPSKGPIEYLDFSTPSVKDPSEGEKEPEPPQPFEYTE